MTLLRADGLQRLPMLSFIHFPQHDEAGVSNPHLLDEETEAQ